MKRNFIFLVIGIMLLLGTPSFAKACHCPGGITIGTVRPNETSCETGYSGSYIDTCTKDGSEGKWVTTNTCTINTYEFTVDMTGTGSGTVSGSGTFDYGSTATATATPDANSTFDGWSGGCDESGSILIDGPKTCTATFTEIEIPEETYTVTATAGDNGDITPASQEAGSGTTVEFTVTPDEGYTATMGGTCPVGTLIGTTYTTGTITGDCTVEATFTEIPEETYTVTATGGDNGSIDPASQEAGSGTSVVFTVTPDEGYTASIGGTCPAGVLDGTTYTTGNITGDCTVEATFTENSTPHTDSYTLTVEKTGTGTGTVTGAGSYTSGSVVTLSVTPDSDSTFDGWSENCPGGVVTVTGDTTCTATFTLKPQETESHNSSGYRRPTSQPEGEVLGAETSCGIYVDKFMKKGLKGNDPEAVKKVQVFLNDYMGSNLKVDGIFGPKTDAAVRAFQARQSDKVLKPWGLDAPTGIFYLTTQTEVNNIMCPDLNLPIPTLIPTDQNPNFPKF